MSKTNEPKWAQTLRQLYTSGVAHAFTLHFNVRDYTVPTMRLPTYLAQLLATKEVIVFYDRRGISFPEPKKKSEAAQELGQDANGEASMKDKFMARVGLKRNDGDSSGGRLSALRAVQSQMGGDEMPKAPEQVLPLLDKLLRESENAAIIILDADTIFPNSDMAMMPPAERTNLVTAMRWGTDLEIGSNSNIVVMVTANQPDLHPNLRSASTKYESITVGLPGIDERLAFARLLVQKNADSENPYDWRISAEEFARLTAGLSYLHLEDITLRAVQEGALTMALVKERKDAILSGEYGDVIESIEPTIGFDKVGGLALVKRFFKRSVINPIRDGRLYRVPKGVLMVGPPGTGKSLIAQAVAKEAGINAVALNLARILGQYVGNTERNLEKALMAIRSLAPTIVFVDEIDQTVSRSSGESGVNSRVFKRLLEFMADPTLRGQVVWLAASNRPDLIDSALKRPGRFDTIIPFFAPTAEERVEILKIMATSFGIDGLTDASIPADVIEQATEGWTGAEIEGAARKAKELMEDEKMDAPTALREATVRLVPSTDSIEYMTFLALEACNDMDYIPEKYRTFLTNRDKLDQEIAQREERQEARGRRSRSL